MQRNADIDTWRDVAARTLAGARRIIDPVWGGMFQYSDKVDWSSPHFEKLLNVQRDAMRAYVLAWQIDHDEADLKAAKDIGRWLMDFMRAPSGAFYTSQDADVSHGEHGDVFYAKADAERRAGPQPPIDRNSYARENGWAIASLAALYDVTGDKALLDAATKAFDWALANRRAPNGGFGHGRAADDDTHLGDTLAIAEAAMALYRSTAERRYLALASEFAEVIARDHRDPAGGFMVRRPEPGAKGVLAKPVKQVDENVAATRLFNLLARNTGRTDFRAAAEHGMRYLIALAEDDLVVPGALLADRELVARARARHHRRRQGRSGGAGAVRRRARLSRRAICASNGSTAAKARCPRPMSSIPRCREAAAFACANGACSVPVFSAGRGRAHRRQGRRPLSNRRMPIPILRVARPTDDIDALLPFYRARPRPHRALPLRGP